MKQGENDKLEYFMELMLCCTDLKGWVYDEGLRILKNYSDSPEENYGFTAQGERIRNLVQECLMPAVIESENGLLWALTAEYTDGSVYYYVLGPALLADKKETSEENAVPLSALPAFGLQELARYACMLHKTVTGQHSAVYIQNAAAAASRDTTAILLLARLQDKVRNGDLHYKELVSEVLTNRRSLMSLGVVTIDSAREVALLTIDLSCQAAIESGLTKSMVDALRKQYLPDLKAASAGYEIAQICDTLMYHLVRLVRRSRGDRSYSEPVQACCTYIEEHACDKLTLDYLAKQTGYSPDHLSKKFRQEFGVPLKDYITRTKIQRAQMMLTTTDMSISDIGAMFSFCSASHFTRVFRQMTGQTPAEYRLKHTHMA